ncbi:RNA polymerase I-specific transcription initiation factor RRN6-like protein [Aspergillus heterothallicus]
MDENTTRSLQYGHMGKPVYCPNTQSWSFSRTLCPPPPISSTGITKAVVRSPSASVSMPWALKKSTLLQGFPELIAGYRSTHSQSVSHMITVTGELCSPLTSTLLEIGRAADFDIDPSGSLSVPIAVFVSGECGDTIAFRTITDDTVDTLQSAPVELRVPTIGDEDTSEWVTEGAPVRQICCSIVENENASFAAARSSSTVIFRPLYRRISASVPTHRGINTTASSCQISRLDPNPLLEISSTHTGGFPHADVKFNPWNQNQIAIVDEEGNWGIWELANQRKRNKDNWIAARVESGVLPWVGVDSQGTRADTRHDGWLTIEWVGDERHVIVCDRKSSMLYRIEDGRVLSSVIELGLRRKSEWILGVKRSTCNPLHVFVLTTSRLFWLDVSSVLMSTHGDLRSSLSPRLSWRHFRDSDDTTLQLTSLEVDEEFYLVLFSRLNQLVLAFRCPLLLEHPTDSEYAPDPFILRVPPSPEDPWEPLSRTVHFSTLVFRQIAPTTVSAAYTHAGLSFIKAFVVDSNLGIQESMYSKVSIRALDGEQARRGDILRIRHQRSSKSRKQTLDDLNEFIIEDRDESTLGASTNTRGIDNISPLLNPQFILDFTDIYATATGTLGLLSQGGMKGPERSFRTLVKELMNQTSSHENSECPRSRTALEILPRTPILEDIDDVAMDLRASFSRSISNHVCLRDTSQLLIHPYDSITGPASHQAKLAGAMEMDLIAIYDRLVNHWLIELPSDIPGRARILKEKAIRHLSGDIVLGQIVAVRSPPMTQSIKQTPHGKSPASSQPNNDFKASSATASGLHETPGLHTQAGTTVIRGELGQGDFLCSGYTAGELPTFTALSAYTNFKSSEPISQDVECILGYWKPGLDPVSSSITTEEYQLASRLKTSRRKSRKKMSLSVKPPGFESSMSLPVGASSPVRPAREWGSQPDNNNSQPPIVRLQSSQVTDDIPMTQVERGIFGGREAVKRSVVKAKKKKRAAGF